MELDMRKRPLTAASLCAVALLGCDDSLPREDTEIVARSAVQPGTSKAPMIKLDLEGPVQLAKVCDPDTRGLGLPLHVCHVWANFSNVGLPTSGPVDDTCPNPANLGGPSFVDSVIPLEGSVCGDHGPGAALGPFNEVRPDSAPFVSSHLYYGAAATGHSLELTLPPRLNGTDGAGYPCESSSSGCKMAPDRAEIVVDGEGFERDYGVGFNFNNPKYFGFAMYVHGSSGFPMGSGVTFMQAWQFGCGRDDAGGTCGVPLAATMTDAPGGSSSPLLFHVTAADDAPDSVARYGLHSVVADTPLAINAWNTFIFFMQPNSNEMPGTGVVQIWLNGVQIADWHGDWGCNVTGTALSDQWHLKAGMYRTGDGVVPNALYTFFDNLRVASSKKQADPAQVF
jgi:hypothetical protein